MMDGKLWRLLKTINHEVEGDSPVFAIDSGDYRLFRSTTGDDALSMTCQN